MDEIKKILEEIKEKLVPKRRAFFEDNGPFTILADPELLCEQAEVERETMDEVAEKYGWKRWRPASRDEEMLWNCMSFYDALSGVRPIAGVYVRDGKYLLLFAKFSMIEFLEAEIVSEERFRNMLEFHRSILEEDIRNGCASYLEE